MEEQSWREAFSLKSPVPARSIPQQHALRRPIRATFVRVVQYTQQIPLKTLRDALYRGDNLFVTLRYIYSQASKCHNSTNYPTMAAYCAAKLLKHKSVLAQPYCSFAPTRARSPRSQSILSALNIYCGARRITPYRIYSAGEITDFFQQKY